MDCPYCGYDNIAGADLCSNCGSDLAGLDLPRQTADGTRKVFHEATVADLQPTAPIVLDIDAKVIDAVRLMQDEGYGAVVVVEKGRMVGLFSELAVLRNFAAGGRDPHRTSLRDAMTDAEALTPENTLGQAVHTMVSNEQHHCPVVNEDRRPVGYVSMRGVLDFLHENSLE